MKNCSKSILVLLIIGILSVSLIACTEEGLDPKNIKGSMGRLEDLTEKDGGLEVIFRLADGEKLKLNTSKDFLSEFSIGGHYNLAYDKEANQILSFDTIKPKDLGSDSNTESKTKVENKTKDIKLSEGKIGIEDLTLVDTVEYMVTSKEKEDNINLYTTAKKDGNGNLILDDGQEWKLIVHTDKGDFLLFDDYVQGKPLDLYVFTEDEDLKIVTIQSGTANLNITEYKYNPKSGLFNSKSKYEAINNINMIYNN